MQFYFLFHKIFLFSGLSLAHEWTFFCYFYISMHEGLDFAVRIMTEYSAFEVLLYGGGEGLDTG